MKRPLRIGEVEIPPGEQLTLDLPVAHLYTKTEIAMPVRALNGRRPGPTLFVCAAIHGDEINGVEIIRRLLKLKLLDRIHGALIVVPVVNVYGLIGRSRYLPDRRDLNRSFPGSEQGSLAARLAHLFMTQIVAHCTHGIDLHTGSNHRANLPQVRACLEDAETGRLAHAFGAPVILHANVRDGSLREAVAERHIPVLVYEGGEPLRFDELSIRIGVKGIVAVMRAIGMLPAKPAPPPRPSLLVHSASWVRAPHSGLLRIKKPLGTLVNQGDLLGLVAHPLGRNEVEVRAHQAGVIIGQVTTPLVNEGEALFHLASAEQGSASMSLEALEEELQLEQAQIRF